MFFPFTVYRVLIFPFLFRFVCFLRCLIRPLVSSKVEEILKFSVSSFLFHSSSQNRLLLSYLNVVTGVNGILHKRLVCYTSYFFLDRFLRFSSNKSGMRLIATIIIIYLGLLVLLSVASLVVMSITITTILQTFFVPLSTTQFNYD